MNKFKFKIKKMKSLSKKIMNCSSNYYKNSQTLNKINSNQLYFKMKLSSQKQRLNK